jgi:hypothetical protein
MHKIRQYALYLKPCAMEGDRVKRLPLKAEKPWVTLLLRGDIFTLLPNMEGTIIVPNVKRYESKFAWNIFCDMLYA